MSNERSGQPVLQLTISLAEVENLKAENAALKDQVAKLKTENASLKKQIQSIHGSTPLPKVISRRPR